jgi:phospholipid/cholesterol/gamma-HCH transport system permease protein
MLTASHPHLVSTASDRQLDLTASGDWTATNAADIEAVVGAIARGPLQGRVTIEASGVTALDTFGAWMLERLMRCAKAAGAEATLSGVPAKYHDLLARIDRTNRRPARVPAARAIVLRGLESLGEATWRAAADLSGLINTTGALANVAMRTLRRPMTFRLTSFVNQLDRVAWQAIPIIALITFLIGCIIAQQGIFHFRKFGADDYVVDLVGILILREIGVLLVAIMVAGRSGSSYTAELGAMKMREEIDALRTMGLDPNEILLLPRVLALMVSLPMLTLMGSLAALYGGGLVAWLYGGMSPAIFIARLQEAISIDHFEVGMIKAPFMALAIGVVACNEGL